MVCFRTAEHLAVRLQLRAGDRFLAALENSREHLELLFAAWRLRLQWVSLPPTCSTALLRGVGQALRPHALAIDNTNSRLLDASRDLRAKSSASSETSQLTTLSVRRTSVAPPRADRLPAGRTPGNGTLNWTNWLRHQPAAVFYTSGSTSSAKGVVLRWQTILEKAHKVLRYYGTSSRDCVLPILPMSHVYGLYPILGALCLGVPAAWVSESASPAAIAQTMEESHATVVLCPPFVARFLFPSKRLKPAVRSRLRVLSLGGAATSPATASAVINALPDTSVFLSYGLVETYSTTCCVDISAEPGRIASVGPVRFLASAEVRHPDTGARVGPGEVGELCICGTITEGFLGMDRRAREAFFTPDGWLRTGDLAHMDERHYVYLRGRLKELINVGGRSIHPSEIEEVLAAHPAVRDCGVFGSEHGERETISGAVVLRESSTEQSASLDDLYDFCRRRLSIKTLPRQIVVVDRIPRGALGKIARAQLRDVAERLRDGANGEETETSDTA